MKYEVKFTNQFKKDLKPNPQYTNGVTTCSLQ